MNNVHPTTIFGFRRPASGGTFAGLAALLLTSLQPAAADSRQNNRAPAVPAALEVPSGHKVAFHAFAVGVQIYEWSGSAWVFVAPEAVLCADANGNGEVAIHYAGPTWESESGSKVVGSRVASSPAPNAIPWLLLEAVSTEGPGVFHRVTYIQRVNTTGGTAPATPGTTAGTRVEVPYTAEYIFYRQQG